MAAIPKTDKLSPEKAFEFLLFLVKRKNTETEIFPESFYAEIIGNITQNPIDSSKDAVLTLVKDYIKNEKNLVSLNNKLEKEIKKTIRGTSMDENEIISQIRQKIEENNFQRDILIKAMTTVDVNIEQTLPINPRTDSPYRWSDFKNGAKPVVTELDPKKLYPESILFLVAITKIAKKQRKVKGRLTFEQIDIPDGPVKYFYDQLYKKLELENLCRELVKELQSEKNTPRQHEILEDLFKKKMKIEEINKEISKFHSPLETEEYDFSKIKEESDRIKGVAVFEDPKLPEYSYSVDSAVETFLKNNGIQVITSTKKKIEIKYYRLENYKGSDDKLYFSENELYYISAPINRFAVVIDPLLVPLYKGGYNVVTKKTKEEKAREEFRTLVQFPIDPDTERPYEWSKIKAQKDPETQKIYNELVTSRLTGLTKREWELQLQRINNKSELGTHEISGKLSELLVKVELLDTGFNKFIPRSGQMKLQLAYQKWELLSDSDRMYYQNNDTKISQVNLNYLSIILDNEEKPNEITESNVSFWVLREKFQLNALNVKKVVEKVSIDYPETQSLVMKNLVMKNFVSKNQIQPILSKLDMEKPEITEEEAKQELNSILSPTQIISLAKQKIADPSVSTNLKNRLEAILNKIDPKPSKSEITKEQAAKEFKSILGIKQNVPFIEIISIAKQKIADPNVSANLKNRLEAVLYKFGPKPPTPEITKEQAAEEFKSILGIITLARQQIAEINKYHTEVVLKKGHSGVVMILEQFEKIRGRLKVRKGKTLGMIGFIVGEKKSRLKVDIPDFDPEKHYSLEQVLPLLIRFDIAYRTGTAKDIFREEYEKVNKSISKIMKQFYDPKNRKIVDDPENVRMVNLKNNLIELLKTYEKVIGYKLPTDEKVISRLSIDEMNNFVKKFREFTPFEDSAKNKKLEHPRPGLWEEIVKKSLARIYERRLTENNVISVPDPKKIPETLVRAIQKKIDNLKNKEEEIVVFEVVYFQKAKKPTLKQAYIKTKLQEYRKEINKDQRNKKLDKEKETELKKKYSIEFEQLSTAEQKMYEKDAEEIYQKKYNKEYQIEISANSVKGTPFEVIYKNKVGTLIGNATKPNVQVKINDDETITVDVRDLETVYHANLAPKIVKPVEIYRIKGEFPSKKSVSPQSDTGPVLLNESEYMEYLEILNIYKNLPQNPKFSDFFPEFKELSKRYSKFNEIYDTEEFNNYILLRSMYKNAVNKEKFYKDHPEFRDLNNRFIKIQRLDKDKSHKLESNTLKYATLLEHNQLAQLPALPTNKFDKDPLFKRYLQLLELSRQPLKTFEEYYPQFEKVHKQYSKLFENKPASDANLYIGYTGTIVEKLPGNKVKFLIDHKPYKLPKETIQKNDIKEVNGNYIITLPKESVKKLKGGRFFISSGPFEGYFGEIVQDLGTVVEFRLNPVNTQIKEIMIVLPFDRLEKISVKEIKQHLNQIEDHEMVDEFNEFNEFNEFDEFDNNEEEPVIKEEDEPEYQHSEVEFSKVNGARSTLSDGISLENQSRIAAEVKATGGKGLTIQQRNLRDEYVRELQNTGTLSQKKREQLFKFDEIDQFARYVTLSKKLNLNKTEKEEFVKLGLKYKHYLEEIKPEQKSLLKNKGRPLTKEEEKELETLQKKEGLTQTEKKQLSTLIKLKEFNEYLQLITYLGNLRASEREKESVKVARLEELALKYSKYLEGLDETDRAALNPKPNNIVPVNQVNSTAQPIRKVNKMNIKEFVQGSRKVLPPLTTEKKKEFKEYITLMFKRENTKEERDRIKELNKYREYYSQYLEDMDPANRLKYHSKGRLVEVTNDPFDKPTAGNEDWFLGGDNFDYSGLNIDEKEYQRKFFEYERKNPKSTLAEIYKNIGNPQSIGRIGIPLISDKGNKKFKYVLPDEFNQEMNEAKLERIRPTQKELYGSPKSTGPTTAELFNNPQKRAELKAQLAQLRKSPPKSPPKAAPRRVVHTETIAPVRAATIAPVRAETIAPVRSAPQKSA